MTLNRSNADRTIPAGPRKLSVGERYLGEFGEKSVVQKEKT